MKVKGLVYVTRKQVVINEFGEKRWNKFIKNFAEREPYFNRIILATSWIPADVFLRFNDAVTEEFYGGDNKILMKLGEAAAEFALKEDGPYRIFVRNKDVKSFSETSAKMIWGTYFSDGKMTIEYDGESKIDVYVSELPIMHEYFEFLVMGYVKRAYEMVSGKSVELKKVYDVDFNSGYHYEVILK